MKKLLSAVCYMALGLLLGSMGFHASSSWQYWAVGLLVITIDLLGGLTSRAVDAAPTSEFESKSNIGLRH